MKTLAIVTAWARSFLDAFVLLKLWQWFIVSLGAPQITYWHALGLSVTASFLGFGICAAIIRQTYEHENIDSIKSLSLVLAFAIGDLLVLLAGFCTHLLMGAHP